MFKKSLTALTIAAAATAMTLPAAIAAPADVASIQGAACTPPSAFP